MSVIHYSGICILNESRTSKDHLSAAMSLVILRANLVLLHFIFSHLIFCFLCFNLLSLDVVIMHLLFYVSLSGNLVFRLLFTDVLD